MRFVALLRGVNVGGHKAVAMSDLRTLVESLGFTDVRSLLQSGNLVFAGTARSASALERTLESETARRLGVETTYFVRTPDDVGAIVAGNPFEEEARRDPGRLVVMLLKEARGAREEASLRAAIKGRERCHVDGRHLYAVYPDGQGTSKFTNAVIEKVLGTRGTARNWNTILKIQAALKSA